MTFNITMAVVAKIRKMLTLIATRYYRIINVSIKSLLDIRRATLELVVRGKVVPLIKRIVHEVPWAWLPVLLVGLLQFLLGWSSVGNCPGRIRIQQTVAEVAEDHRRTPASETASPAVPAHFCHCTHLHKHTHKQTISNDMCSLQLHCFEYFCIGFGPIPVWRLCISKDLGHIEWHY